MLNESIEDYFHYLQIERGLSDNTLTSYRRDIEHYSRYVSKVIQKSTWNAVSRSDIVGFLHILRDDGKSSSTIARTISSIRSFHQFLIREQLTHHDPTVHIELPR